MKAKPSIKIPQWRNFSYWHPLETITSHAAIGVEDGFQLKFRNSGLPSLFTLPAWIWLRGPPMPPLAEDGTAVWQNRPKRTLPTSILRAWAMSGRLITSPETTTNLTDRTQVYREWNTYRPTAHTKAESHPLDCKNHLYSVRCVLYRVIWVCKRCLLRV